MRFGHNGSVVLESSLPAAVRRGMRRLARRAKGESSSRSLQVVVCGGTCEEWSRRSDDEWNQWASEISAAAAREGVGSVTAYPLRGSTSTSAAIRRWNIAGVALIACEQPDGHRRMADVIDAWPSGLAMTEETLGRALVGPGGDPDVVAVVGASDRLPTALVWELAYAELVDVAVSWESFSGRELSAVIGEFRTRNRRFGGVDESP